MGAGLRAARAAVAVDRERGQGGQVGKVRDPWPPASIWKTAQAQDVALQAAALVEELEALPAVARAAWKRPVGALELAVLAVRP